MVMIIKVTYPNKEEADEAIASLLKKGLISSANLLKIKSTSRWTGEIKEVDEILVLFKTNNNDWIKVRDEIKKLHSYEIPCIIKIDGEANLEYEEWVNKQTGKP
jgi:periplasmic divalent cation tolerance protein